MGLLNFSFSPLLSLPLSRFTSTRLDLLPKIHIFILYGNYYFYEVVRCFEFSFIGFEPTKNICLESVILRLFVTLLGFRNAIYDVSRKSRLWKCNAPNHF